MFNFESFHTFDDLHQKILIFKETGASDNPCEEIYQGQSPFSEPESSAIRKFITWYKRDIEAVITMHTYSQLWIHPYGHRRFIYPEDVDDLVII